MGAFTAAGNIASASGLTGLDVTSTFSVALWWQCASALGTDIFTQKNAAGASDGIALFHSSSTGLTLRTWNGSTATSYNAQAALGFKLGSGRWNHIAVTADGATVCFYLNGMCVSSAAQTANATIAGTRDTLVANFGIAGDHPQTQSDLRVWAGYALKPSEVLYIAQGHRLKNETARWFVGRVVPRDLSANANHLSLVNGVTGADPDSRSLIRPNRSTVFRNTSSAPATPLLPIRSVAGGFGGFLGGR